MTYRLTSSLAVLASRSCSMNYSVMVSKAWIRSTKSKTATFGRSYTTLRFVVACMYSSRADIVTQGSTPALFVGTAAFEVIVKQQIKRLEDPGLKCCQLVYDELIRILGQLLTKIVRPLMILSSISPKDVVRIPLASIPSVPRTA